MQHSDSIKLIKYYAKLQIGRMIQAGTKSYIPDWLYWLEFGVANRN